MTSNFDFTGMLNCIPPDCSYDEWLKVGMALKHEGQPFEIWDAWSSNGSKYRPNEMKSKWNSFRRNDVTGGTLFHIAEGYGYKPNNADPNAGHYDLHNLLLDEFHIDPTFVRDEIVPQAAQNYDAKGEMLEYFTTMFQPDEYVGYCVKFEKDGDRWKPVGGKYNRTAGQIIEILRKDDPEKALGTVTGGNGGWVRFNPLDGKGENNSNVTRWKHCLIESDEISIEKQYALIKSMNLPCTFVINSGGKSLHALVRVDAENAQQYRDRVRDLYEFARKSGFRPDEQDKNESRFSRLPGIKRGDRWQYIVARNIGAESYQAWLDWRQAEADDLPPDVNLADVWNDMPPLNEELIPGLLRVGHKMLLTGPSKAGKSFLLMNLVISLAEGVEWLGMRCRQGKVCYVNLELDSASCFHRFKEIYEQRHLTPRHLDNIDVWNLRGHAVPMNRLAPILIHRFKDQNYEAVIIDPIYKVITGDENNATEMSQFCSYFDQVATEMGVATIYCHHHSKGAIDKYSSAMDRSSGSGVFARDPDAILDMAEVKTEGCEANYRHLNGIAEDKVLTGWEFSATLREFNPMPSFYVWFNYPVHSLDENGDLKSAAKKRNTDHGVGKDQQSKSDLFRDVADALQAVRDLNGDTAIDLEIAGGRREYFTGGTDFECATIDKQKVVHLRLEDEIFWKGKRYYRVPHGSHSKWVLDDDEFPKTKR